MEVMHIQGIGMIPLPGGANLILEWNSGKRIRPVCTLRCQCLHLIKRKIAIDKLLEQKLLKAKPGDQYTDTALGGLLYKLTSIGKSSEKNSLQQLCKNVFHKLALLKQLDTNSLTLWPQDLVLDIIPELEGALGLKRAELDKLRLWLIAHEQQQDVSLENKREQLRKKAADIAQCLQCNAQNREKKKNLLLFMPELISIAWNELNQWVLNYGFMLNGSLRFKLASWFINHKNSQMPLLWRVNLGCIVSLDETKKERINAIMHDLATAIRNDNIAYSVNNCFSNDNTFKNNSVLDYMLPFDNSEISIKRLEELTSACKQVDIFTKPLQYLAVQTKHAIDEHSFSLRQLLWMTWLVDTIVILEETALERERKANVGMCLMLSNIPYLEKSCLEMFPEHQSLAQELLSLMKKVRKAMVDSFKQNTVEDSHGSNISFTSMF